MSDEVYNELVIEHRAIIKDLGKIVNDHEKRIRLLERVAIIGLTVVAIVKFFIFK